jgi:hypothetical protein
MEDKNQGVGGQRAEIDIAGAMRRLIDRFQQPFEGVSIPIKPVCEEDWGPNYAVAKDWYLDFCEPAPKVFSMDGFLSRFRQTLLDFFGKDAKFSTNRNDFSNGTIVILLHFETQEIEVFRKGFASQKHFPPAIKDL